MLPLLLAALVWQAPSGIQIPAGGAHRFELPPVAGGARLVVRARLIDWRPAGSTTCLRIAVNGVDVGPMRDRRTPRLLSTPPAFRSGGTALAPAAFGLWRVPFGPATTAADALVLDVGDLLHADAPSTLVLEHANAGSGRPALALDALAVEDTGGPPPARAAPIVELPPRLRLPAPPPFTAAADPEAVRVTWAGRTIEVTTAVTPGPARRKREIAVHPTHVEVRDTIANPTAEVIGLRVRHAVAADADRTWLGGRADPALDDAYDPWNPTIFTRVAAGGVGLVAEDDVFRQQVRVDYEAARGTAGLRTESLCLAPGARVTLVWSVYPTRTGEYWDFINTVRRDWGVDRTLPGSYVWFWPEQVLDPPEADLARALERQRVAIASTNGGWVDHRRADHPPRIGFGTDVLSDAFAGYRDRIRAAADRLRRLRPGIRVLVYFDAQRDSSPDAERRFADSLLVPPGAAVERTDWDGRFSPSWGMVPTRTNAFGRAMGDVAAAMRDVGADGLYWDEMDAVAYTAPRLTTSVWDGHTCEVGETGTVGRRLGLTTLLSEDAKLAWADGRFVVGNTPPTTRAFQDRGDIRIVEAQHGRGYGAFAHLSAPLGYTGSRDWSAVLDALGEGLLVAGARLDSDWDILARTFPFTPEYVQAGTLRGRERIVTTASGTHGWTDGGAVRLYRYDGSGHEHPASWHVKDRHGGTFVHVRLAPGEAAVIERESPPRSAGLRAAP